MQTPTEATDPRSSLPCRSRRPTTAAARIEAWIESFVCLWAAGWLLVTPSSALHAPVVFGLLTLGGVLPSVATRSISARATAVVLAVTTLGGDAGIARLTFAAGALVLAPCRSATRAVAIVTVLDAAVPALPFAYHAATIGHDGLVSLLSLGRKLGPTATAASLLVLALTVLALDTRRSGARPWMVVPAIAILCVWIGHARWVEHAALADTTGRMAFTWAPWLAGACAALASWGAFAERRDAILAPRRDYAAGLVLGVVAGGLSIGEACGPAPTSARVAFLNDGGFDWDRPVVGKYGGFDAGMFGLLPIYLEADGFECSAIRAEGLADRTLAEVDLLVTINCPRLLDARERDAVDQFLRRGGNVLVLGDHTNVFGLQDGYNSWLDRYGIRFQFDSAYHCRSGWTGCLSPAWFAPRSTARPRFAANHAIGASLACSGRARPILIGRHAFSDIGEPENYGGAFLGNYQLDPDERLGDTPLIAQAVVGRGRLVVYGDTSAFQNSGLGADYLAHALPVFRWLARPAWWGERWYGRLVLALSLALGLGALARRRRIVIGRTFVVALALTVVVLDWSARSRARWPAVGPETVLVDTSHCQRIGHYDAQMNSIHNLYGNLARVGLRSLRMRTWDNGAVESAAGVISVAPNGAFSNQEIDAIQRMLERGGRMILALDAGDARCVAALLQRFGVRVESLPLGTVPDHAALERDELLPRFWSAWPVVAGADAESLARVGQHDLALHIPVGRGGLIVIGDDRFFSSQNLVGAWKFWPGNVRFVYHLLCDYFGGDDARWHNRFDPPTKTE